MNVEKFIEKIENHKFLNWKTLLFCYLVTRIFVVLILNYGTWNGKSMLCYTADCQMHWHNVQWIVQGLNPYKEWIAIGGYSLPTPLRTDWPPFFLILISSFAFFWRSIWSMRAIFFIFDLFNIVLIYKIVKFKKISTMLYILSPLVLRAILFPEEELLVAFLLLSIYLFEKQKYILSSIALALSFNHKVFPIFLFPALLLSMKIFERKRGGHILPTRINFKKLISQIGIFLSVSLFWHLFYFPDWIAAYTFRSGRYIENSDWLIWKFISIDNFLLILSFVFVLFYLYVYIREINIKTSYLLGSLIFISLFPKFSFDHLTFLIPLFLVWTQWTKTEIIFWIFLTIGSCLEFLSLPTIGIISKSMALVITISILLSFYLIVITFLIKRKTNSKF